MEGKGSSLVHLLVIVLSLTAFGFAIAAERRRSTVKKPFFLYCFLNIELDLVLACMLWLSLASVLEVQLKWDLAFLLHSPF